MVKENTMFLAALIIWSRLKSPTTAMLMGIGGRNGPPELFSLFLRCFYPLLYIFFFVRIDFEKHFPFLEYLWLEIFLEDIHEDFYLFSFFF